MGTQRDIAQWKWFSKERQIELEKATICATYLCVYLRAHAGSGYDQQQHSDVRVFYDFFKYCAKHWLSHLRDDFVRHNDRLLTKVVSLLTVKGGLFRDWFQVTAPSSFNYYYRWRLPQHIIASAGLGYVLQKVLTEDGDSVRLDAVDDGMTALDIAAAMGHEKIVHILLSAGANANARNRIGRTALYWASGYGHERIVQALLDAGVNFDARTGGGRTPLLAASVLGHDKAVRILLDAGANAEAGTTL